MFDEDFDRYFEEQQAEKWANGTYVDHCKDCSGEDCQCCQYNPRFEEERY